MKKLMFLAVLLVFVGSAFGVADITTGLKGWWKLDETSGITAVDSSGYGNDGTIGSSDKWEAGRGLDFDGGSWGASGIVFANNGADLIADMALSNKVTVSYFGTWDAYINGANYPFDGRNASNLRKLSAECPTGTHLLNHVGGYGAWAWEAFNEFDGRFIFQKNGLGKTWGDMILITMTVDFTTGDYKLYVDGQLYVSEGGISGSFSDLATFTLGRTLWAEMEGNMKDVRIYDRALSASDVAELVPEPATLVLLGLGGLTLIRRKRS